MQPSKRGRCGGCLERRSAARIGKSRWGEDTRPRTWTWFVCKGDDKSNSSNVVDFKLPKPAYTGTPKNIPPGTTAEKPSGKPRAPWSAPAGVKNLALNKPVTSSDKDPIIGKLEQVTDGDKEGSDGSWVELAPGLQWVQIDLGKSSDIYGILLWHQ